MVNRLTPKQARFLSRLITFVEENRRPPSIREALPLANATSTRSVTQYLNALEEAGYIARDENTRQIRILEDPTEAQRTAKAPPPSRRARAEQSIRPTPGPLLVKGSDLRAWADRRDSQSQFPDVVRRLVFATTPNPHRVFFRSGEGVQLGGWDGITEATERTPFVPDGISGWELGTSSAVRGKADADLEARTSNPLEVDPAQTTFIFVTLRRWRDKETWAAEQRKKQVWRDVRAYDADDLELWLERAPAVHYWISARLGKHPEGAIDLGSFWEQWATATNPVLSPALVLAGRTEAGMKALELLKAMDAPAILQAETREEAVAAFAAAIQLLPEAERFSHELRSVVVFTPEAWQQLSCSHERLILIPLFESRSAVTNALRNGHQVLVPLGRGDSNSQKTLPLGPIARDAAEKELRSLGIEENRARELARLLRRSTTAFRRYIAVAREVQQPAWADPANGRAILPVLLAGKWDEGNEADRAAISRLANVAYDDLLPNLVRWSNETDAPVRHIGRYWFIVSKEDSWPLLARYLTRDDLRHFHDVATDVLGTTDPRYDLPTEKQWMANILGHSHKYSSALTEGLGNTLALMGVHGDLTRITAGESARAIAAGVVRSLFERMNSDPHLWATLSHVLPLLAEAAPDQFLDGVDIGLSGNPPVLRSIFVDEKGSTLFVSSPHTGLLWALERLGWSPEYLGRAAVALSRLATIDPGGTLSNRPMESLRQLFLFWHPQTHASIEQRLAVLDRLRKLMADVGWNLMISLLPKSHDMSMNHTPAEWRDWGMDIQAVTLGEYARGVHEVVRRLIDDVNANGKWRDLVQNLSQLPEADQTAILDSLAAVKPTDLPPTSQKELWDSLREFISLHRTHDDASWALSAERIDRLLNVYKRFTPEDITERFAWLFSARPALLEGRESNWEEHQRLLTRDRAEAVRDIYSQSGLLAVVEFARTTERVNEVGSSLAATEIAQDDGERILDSYLASSAEHEARLAKGFAYENVYRRGREWAERILENKGNEWRPEQRAELLSCLPYDTGTWNLVDHEDEPTQSAYWQRVYAFGIPDTHVEYGVRRLLLHGRPFAAIDYLAGQVHTKKGVKPELIADTLEAIIHAKPSEKDPVDPTFGYDIGDLLDALASNPGDVSLRRIAALEWAFVRLLSNNAHTPRVLHDELGRDPDFFCDLIAIVYRAKGEEPRALNEAEQAQARAAHDLLESWQRVPGTLPDGSVDAKKLREWIDSARAKLRDLGRSEIGDLAIGKVLSGCPTGDDGLWPHVAIREVIEDLASTDLERGIAIEVYNSRGVVTRSLHEGGDQERALVERYFGYAAAMNDHWSRTAAMLRRIADSYSDEASHADIEVEVRENWEV